jgi:hypothetical protein
MRSFAKELAPFGTHAKATLAGIVSAGMARRQWDEDASYRRRAGDGLEQLPWTGTEPWQPRRECTKLSRTDKAAAITDSI